MDTQPVEEMGVEVETGNLPSLDPVTADTAEHCADSPGQPAESANLAATSSVPKNAMQEETKETTDDVRECTDKTITPANSQEDSAAKQEPEVKVKENTTSTQTSEDPAGADKEPVKDPQGAAAETEELEDGETLAKKPKVATEEEASLSNPKKVFCEE